MAHIEAYAALRAEPLWHRPKPAGVITISLADTMAFNEDLVTPSGYRWELSSKQVIEFPPDAIAAASLPEYDVEYMPLNQRYSFMWTCASDKSDKDGGELTPETMDLRRICRPTYVKLSPCDYVFPIFFLLVANILQ